MQFSLFSDAFLGKPHSHFTIRYISLTYSYKKHSIAVKDQVDIIGSGKDLPISGFYQNLKKAVGILTTQSAYSD